MSRQLDDGKVVSGSFALLESQQSDGSTMNQGDLRFGAAWRPLESDWIFLNRLDLVFNENKDTTFDTTTRKIVENMNANYSPTGRWQLALQLGLKYSLDDVGGEDYFGTTSLTGAEYRFDLTDRWDIGVRGSMLHSFGTQTIELLHGRVGRLQPVQEHVGLGRLQRDRLRGRRFHRRRLHRAGTVSEAALQGRSGFDAGVPELRLVCRIERRPCSLSSCALSGRASSATIPREDRSGNPMTRRDWLTLAGLGALAGARGVVGNEVATPDAVQRIAQVIREYEAQGWHCTGTRVDNASGDWLAEEVGRAGVRAELEPFALDPVDPVTCTLSIRRRIEGLPLFDGAFTSAAGIDGALGIDIALTETAVNAAARGALGDLRRSGQYRAIVAVTKGRTPGLCPRIADAFLNPFGPPVLQVSSEEGTRLAEQARLGCGGAPRGARRSSSCDREQRHRRGDGNAADTSAARRDDPAQRLVCVQQRTRRRHCLLARSHAGAYSNAGATIGALRRVERTRARPSRHRRIHRATQWHRWQHDCVGTPRANIGAATDKTTLLQAADDEIDAAATGCLKSVGMDVTMRAPRGSVPAGEAEAVHRGGGRYVSFIGGNALFHHVDDVGAGATDPATIARFRRGTDRTHPRACVGSLTPVVRIVASGSLRLPRRTADRAVVALYRHTGDLSAPFRFRAIRPRCGRLNPRRRRLRSPCGRSRAEHPRWYRAALSR